MERFLSTLTRSRATRIAAVLAFLGAIGLAAQSQLQAQPYSTSHNEALDTARSLGKAFTGISAEVIPSVVTISSNKVIRLANGNPHGEEFDQFFHRFFGTPRGKGGEMRQRALGSGVIMGDDGYIITNNHVVADAEEITVTLSDGEEYDAKIIGTDPKTDIAVIKVDGRSLHAAEFGNSDEVEVGEWVLAVGSPFSMNLGATVTAGIVSGMGRGLRLADYEDFIQTDAAINPGNSGGALVNLNGEVIGINTAIATRSGGSQGVGFAIPINMARKIANDLIQDGKVTRGWIGIGIQDITKDFQDAFDLPNRSGVLISRVWEDSPAEKAGLEQGDVIRYLDDDEIGSMREFRNKVAGMSPGSSVKLGVHRNGKVRTRTVRLGTFPDDEEVIASAPAESTEKLGIDAATINGELRSRFDLDRRDGLVVVDVKRGSAAARKDIRPGDVILEFNQAEIRSLRDYRAASGELDAGDVALLLVERGGATFFVAVRVPE